MKQTLVIGSCCVDVTLNIPSMPNPGMDENITTQKMTVGGCAFNVANILRQFKLPHTLCSPVGSGIYGDFIKNRFAEYKMPVFASTPEIENGCCYCIVEKNGRRTFLCKHGAEYRFDSKWFSKIDFSNVDSVYFCGLEIEDVDGDKIIAFLEDKKSESTINSRSLELFFAPGPRINSIAKEKLQKIFSLHPILHLNDEEATSFTNTHEVPDAAQELYKATGNSLVITCGKDGAYCYDKSLNEGKNIACSTHVKAIDTTGAGDSHCGTVISSIKQGFSLFDSVKRANSIASVVVTQNGSNLTDQAFIKACIALQ